MAKQTSPAMGQGKKAFGGANFPPGKGKGKSSSNMPPGKTPPKGMPPGNMPMSNK